MKNALSFTVLILISLNLNAQPWKFIEKRNARNVPCIAIETYDKGIVIPVLNPDVTPYLDIFLYKLDVNGDLIWKKNFNYKDKYFESTSVLQLTNGGYLISGSTEAIASGTEEGDPFLLKLNNCFEPEWFKVYYEPLGFNRIDHVLEYEGNLLVSFAFLNSNYITLTLLDASGKFIKKKTIPDIFTDNIYIRKDKTIQLISFKGIFGLGPNPNVGVDKSVLIDFDSNLNITKFRYYRLMDSTFDNISYAMCYIDSNENNFLTLGSHRNPNSKNSNIDGCVMITKNLDDNGLIKIINDTTTYTSGYTMIKLDNNRFAISSNYNPDLNQPFLYYGENFIIDSNANLIYSAFENKGTETSETRNLLRTYDGNLVSIGSKYKDGNSSDIFCYKYNPDLTPFIKKNIIKNYDTLCSQVLTTSTTILPDPQVVYLYKDSFLSKLNRIKPGNPDIKIFPNPATEKINIDSDASYSVDVFDITGRKIFQGENITELTLPKGIYFIHFQKDDTVFIRKVIFTGN